MADGLPTPKKMVCVIPELPASSCPVFVPSPIHEGPEPCRTPRSVGFCAQNTAPHGHKSAWRATTADFRPDTANCCLPLSCMAPGYYDATWAGCTPLGSAQTPPRRRGFWLFWPDAPGPVYKYWLPTLARHRETCLCMRSHDVVGYVCTQADCKCHARSHTLLTVAMDKKVLGAILNTASRP